MVMMVVVENMEKRGGYASKKLNFIAFLTLLHGFTEVTCNHHEINQEFLPWPLKVQRRGANEVCETAACNEAAEMIKQNLNVSVDPCDDFYEFACGGWISKHPVLPSEPDRNQFGAIGEKVEAEIREILEAPINPDEPDAVKSAKKFYSSCKDTDHLEEEGLDQLIEVVNGLGGWPLATDNWDDRNFNWQLVVGKIIKEIGTIPLITLYVYRDQKNSSRNVIINDQSMLPFPREMLVNSKIYKTYLDAYRNYIVGLAEELVKAGNLIIPTSRITAEVDELIDFEIKLAEKTLPSVNRLDEYRMYNLKTLQELQSLTDAVKTTHDYARIDWKLILDTVFAGLDFTFSPDEAIIVKEVDFLPELVKLLDSTPLRVIANYINFKAVHELSSYTTKKLRDIQFELGSTLSGVTEQPPRWKYCLSGTSSGLAMAVGYAYVKKYFDHKTKQTAQHMVEAIRRQFSSSINDVEWMDAATKKVAKEKAEEMEENIGYPNWFSNSSAFDEYYRGISVGESYLASMLSLTLVTNDHWLANLRKPTDRSEWLMGPQIVNAFYNPASNNILLPAGILKSPFFETDRPKAMNFGSIGAVIGHEITHGFDDKGRQSDKHGNLAQWWSQNTIDTYIEKTQCFIEQYGNYRVPELDAIQHTEVKMNGALTLGENIADNGGVRQAFLSYKKYVDKNGPEKRLPGLEEYSPEQLFFLNFAMSWCGTSRLEIKLNQVMTDSHSLGKFRVKGTLSNSEQFAEIWECPLGSPMNPPNKCKIW